jgi:hypothetical protein
MPESDTNHHRGAHRWQRAHVRAGDQTETPAHAAFRAFGAVRQAGKSARGNRGLAQLTRLASTAALIDQLRADGTILTDDPDGRALHVRAPASCQFSSMSVGIMNWRKAWSL